MLDLPLIIIITIHYFYQINKMATSFNPTFRFLQEFVQKTKQSQLPQSEEIAGIQIVECVPAARIAEQRDKCVIRPDDVFVATYPKSGTTWTQQIVKLIANNGVETGINIDVFAPWHEHMSLEEMDAMPSPRVFKSHLPYQLMPGGGDPANTKAKYIYVIRNPKDVAVSKYNRVLTSTPQQHVPASWNDFFIQFMEGNVTCGPFYDHFLGWWAHRDAPNILILTYEQMKRNPRTAVTSIASFLGYSLTDEVIDKIVIDSSFDKMKNNEHCNMKYVDFMSISEGSDFLRKGVIGDWRNVFTSEQSAMMDALVEEKMKASGLVFDYGDD